MALAVKTLYLILYNGIFAALWLTLFLRIVALGPLSSHDKTYDTIGNFALWIQTAALLEVVHSATGPLKNPPPPPLLILAMILVSMSKARKPPSLTPLSTHEGLVRAPLIPTFIQTVAKNLVLWTIVAPFPAVALSPAYTVMLVMWSSGEVIRYGYFALMLSGRRPGFLVWLRYSAFVGIYPVGIAAEMWLVWRAIGEPASKWVTGIMYGELLGLYLPGSYYLYSYMLRQRSKTLRLKNA
ncbi:uncharacterized protein L3040_003917 [Drepanopeziza brunnea f. sp. 'multigermtubi']|uniref:Very-long-chain (3R)-3-hydroxyacyl-CoA dehydratase n=1 Tax=Marssonina brunnea f. sp. multigermtubi (strain MB_m1) TaxID=1072389 RepID=K1WPG7_MARBU|nr:protein tyrosine phosphatase [Drepanopeziza brunnea f. sp. 'multigermtubi' MB_m1]EKD14866.1 protein tyrosine phosphatase [Drepanopeziza brunnea f. sp. 'multigermtubi' MB_m1]KAJ5046684.1 hypothetical protein L3040_003917 [Drepanopeziza brunnea f. sp. 'multigermtubi']